MLSPEQIQEPPPETTLRQGMSPSKGIRVLGTDLEPCGMGRALLRHFLLVVDGVLGGLVGVLVISLSKDWQRIGDSAARTVIVRTTPPTPA